VAEESGRETSERAAATEARILRAAERAFARRGLAGTRVREIAQAAGVNPATLYLYFPSKQALYQAVLDRGFRPVIEWVESFDASPSAAERRSALERLVGDVLRHLAGRPYLSRLVYHEAISGGELLPHLARAWVGPLIERIALHIKGAPARAGWEESQLALVAAALLHVVFGHFALAPLLAEVLERDPLAPEGLREQTRLVTELLLRIFPEEDPR
jgi:TetR/AcrR family transcriptional regulator